MKSGFLIISAFLSSISIWLLVGIAIFLFIYILLIRKPYKKANPGLRIFLTILPVTICFVFYFGTTMAVTLRTAMLGFYNVNSSAINGLIGTVGPTVSPADVGAQLTGLMTGANFGFLEVFFAGQGFLFLLISFLLYLLIVFIIIIGNIRPLRKVHQAINQLSATGTIDKKTKKKVKGYKYIFESLDNLETKMDVEKKTAALSLNASSKLMPKQYATLSGNQDLMNLNLKNYSERDAFLMNFKILHKEDSQLEEMFKISNEIYAKIGVVIRKYNGTVKNFSAEGFQAVFLNEHSATTCEKEINKISKSISNISVEIKPTRVLMGLFGDDKHQSFGIIYR